MTNSDQALTSSDLTVTERLRELLDERGVRWRNPNSFMSRIQTVWDASGFTWVAIERNDGYLRVESSTVFLTPEQAIEATLGRGTCKVECFDDGVDEGLDGEWYSYSPPTWYLSCGHTCEGLEGPNFCPNCGREVIE